jgi:hypothetical protein
MAVFKRAVFMLLPVLVSAALPARAETPPGGATPKFFGVFASTVGGWSEYAVTETEGGKKSTMRNAVVGKEGDAFWYEVAITEDGVRNIIKMFLKGDPNNPENIQRLIMKNGDQAAQEMPREFVVMGRRMATSMFETRSGSTVVNQPDLKIEEVGTEKVTVPAGTFTVTKNRVVDGTGKVLATYDFSKDVLPMGIVRSTTDKVKIELIANGKDAVSLITEKPVMMKRPPGMPDNNPRGTPPGMEAPKSAPATGGYGSPAPAPATGGYGSPAPAAPAPATGGYGK